MTEPGDGTKKAAGDRAQWKSVPPPFYHHLGLIPEVLENGQARIRLPYQAPFANSRGEVHGGMAASLLDITMAQAVRSTIAAGSSVATISLTLNYLGPAMGDLTAHGLVVRSGRSVAFAEGKVTDGQGRVVSTAVGVFRVIAPRTDEVK